jgi:predicted house-cleaning noncanonical NTP pyrophosphatase (MazG superfamily)
MDIRLAQKIIWGDKQVNASDVIDVPLGLCLLSKEVAAASVAWHDGRREVSEELAGVVILALVLAEMIGTDLQRAVEAKLALTGTARWGRLTDAVRADAAGVTAGMRDGKLVRDKIPQIIRSKGQEPLIYTASPEEYGIRLRDKLREEVEEFLASDNDPEELADILEVLHALADQTGADQQQLEKLRATKAEMRGGFAGRVIWSGNQPRGG